MIAKQTRSMTILGAALFAGTLLVATASCAMDNDAMMQQSDSMSKENSTMMHKDDMDHDGSMMKKQGDMDKGDTAMMKKQDKTDGDAMMKKHDDTSMENDSW